MTDRDGRTPLHYAALEGATEEVRRLVAGGADPNSSDRRGLTPLHFAAQEWAAAAAEALLTVGADVDAADGYGDTPLHAAVFNGRGRGDLIALLRRHGADPSHANHSGQTPVGLTRLIGNFDVAQFFADLGSDDPSRTP